MLARSALIREGENTASSSSFLPVIALGADPMAPTQTPTEHVAEGLRPYDRLGRDNVTVERSKRAVVVARTTTIGQSGAPTCAR